ncbi:SMC-Scp complex subunit ScpB [Stenotrophomonas sp.]|uniref:SMC-Scp complex subunit ScpB n=1 Tax=Stenotrophomonas sp. TaxID=69392 RepID=UPI0025EFA80B|nr:SMC-Scp complex subunit ScpB [Stenotrophomonas sp.]MBW8372949.1 SMC-Scp complex subunit ScpB [Stenotrophomonas sp.]
MDQPLINRIVEGALLAASEPLTLAQLQGLFPEEEPAPPGSIERALELLREGCQDRGVELVEVASGFRFQVTSEVHGYITRLWTERKTRYTRATLETLALIAYRQPITRGEIEQVRGVAVSSNIIQALEEREWIRVIGHRDVPGKPALFGTTKGFLDYFGLKRLDELPPLSELRDLGELEPQLPLDSEGQPAGRLPAGAATPEAELDTDAANDDATPAPSEPQDPADPVDPAAARLAARVALASARLAEQPADPDNSDAPADADASDTPSHAPLSLADDDADTTASDGEPDTAPGERAAPQNETENNAVAKTTVAVDEADPEPEADASDAGRSQVNE